MAYLLPKDRYQTRFNSLEEPIDKENPVRFIDAFVDALELSTLNFIVSDSKTIWQKRPAYKTGFWH